MQIKPFLITITGPSQSGKSTVLRKIKTIAPILNAEGYVFLPQLIKKKTTRDYRVEELQNLEAGKEIDVEHVDFIPNECDLIYQTYGMRYALSTKDIKILLGEGKTPFVVINDIRVVEELKREFPEQVLSIFLFRKIPELEDFHKEAASRGNVSESEATARYEKAVAIYRMYIENIALFDKVILNAIEYKQNDLDNPEVNIIDRQLLNILKGVLDGKIKLRKNSAALHSEIPKTFILAGNAASGKDELLRAIQSLGKLQAEIIPKYTVRRQEKDDEDEIICRLRPKQVIVELLKQRCLKDRENVFSELNKIDESIKDRFMKEWEEMKKKISLKIPDWKDLFWAQIDAGNDENLFFEDNPLYVDLNQIVEKGRIEYREDDGTVLVEYLGKEYIIYSAKGNKNKLYGCVLDRQNTTGKYRVLVASQNGVFNIFKNELGSDNVAVIYAHSQISVDEFASNATDSSVKEKREKFNEYLTDYVNNIAYYDHVVIFAKSRFAAGQSIKEEELIDQMFRLFRAY